MVTSKHVLVTLHALTLALACKEPGDAGPGSESTASDETAPAGWRQSSFLVRKVAP